MFYREVQLRETEIQNFHLPAFNKKDVRGFDVAVDNSLGVSTVEPCSDLNADLQKFRYFDRLRADPVLESLALEKFHSDKGPAFELSNVVQSADVRVVERGCGAGFAAKSFDGLGVVRNVVGEEFQRNASAEARVLGFVHHAHSAAAQLFHYAIVRDVAAYDRSIGHGHWSLLQRCHAGNRVTRAGRVRERRLWFRELLAAQ